MNATQQAKEHSRFLEESAESYARRAWARLTSPKKYPVWAIQPLNSAAFEKERARFMAQQSIKLFNEAANYESPYLRPGNQAGNTRP